MRDRNSTLFDLAPLTFTFMTVCIGLYLWTAYQSMQNGGGGAGSISMEVLLNMGAAWREGLWDGGLQRLILPMFLHGGFMHILFNMLALYQLGPASELRFGTANFGTIFLLSGIASTCISLIFGGGVSVGASGSVFGILGAFLGAQLVGQVDLRRALRSSSIRQTAGYIALNFLICFFIPNVDNWGHLGGLLMGTGLGALMAHWQKKQHINWALLLAAGMLTLGLMAAARWMVFNPHYHVHAAIRAEEAGEHGVAKAEFEQAGIWSERLFKSEKGTMELGEAFNKAREDMNFKRMEYYAYWLRILAPDWFKKKYPHAVWDAQDIPEDEDP